MSTGIEKESAEARYDLQAVYAEMFPHRDPESMRVDDDTLAAVVLFRRELTLLEKRMKWRNTPNTEA